MTYYWHKIPQFDSIFARKEQIDGFLKFNPVVEKAQTPWGTIKLIVSSALEGDQMLFVSDGKLVALGQKGKIFIYKEPIKLTVTLDDILGT